MRREDGPMPVRIIGLDGVAVEEMNGVMVVCPVSMLSEVKAGMEIARLANALIDEGPIAIERVFSKGQIHGGGGTFKEGEGVGLSERARTDEEEEGTHERRRMDD